MSKTKYLFVDGAYLRRALEVISEKYFSNADIEVSPEHLASPKTSVHSMDECGFLRRVRSSLRREAGLESRVVDASSLRSLWVRRCGGPEHPDSGFKVLRQHFSGLLSTSSKRKKADCQGFHDRKR